MKKILLDIGKEYAHTGVDYYFEYGDYYYTTDTRLLVIIPKKYIEETLQIKKESTPKIGGLLKVKPTHTTPIKLTQLVKALSSVPIIPSHDDCSDCNGYGNTDCECCGNIKQCKTCLGKGVGKANGNFEFDYEYNIKIMGCYISVIILNRLVNGLYGIGYKDDDTIQFAFNDQHRLVFMDIDGITMILQTTNMELITKWSKIIEL
jgi:hypothetical protein